MQATFLLILSTALSSVSAGPIGRSHALVARADSCDCLFVGVKNPSLSYVCPVGADNIFNCNACYQSAHQSFFTGYPGTMCPGTQLCVDTSPTATSGYKPCGNK
ncbi:hypothetical protein NA57DRAFT_55501 [Rhizodiscina lignyota]|uniref:Uncharacterized protein n=1 Tax=Rhizodiscina lignyota TaxID=1504668 RepID=A0A9P4IHT3_9PEZI|nr:hypothetical protein NA57DRAFT_55501 [Rhizodiscina lignyota]